MQLCISIYIILWHRYDLQFYFQGQHSHVVKLIGGGNSVMPGARRQDINIHTCNIDLDGSLGAISNV